MIKGEKAAVAHTFEEIHRLTLIGLLNFVILFLFSLFLQWNMP